MTQMCHILTLPGLSCRNGRIFMVQNGWYRCPAYSTTCFVFNRHLWGYLRPLKSVLSKIATSGCFGVKIYHYRGVLNAGMVGQNEFLLKVRWYEKSILVLEPKSVHKYIFVKNYHSHKLFCHKSAPSIADYQHEILLLVREPFKSYLADFVR